MDDIEEENFDLSRFMEHFPIEGDSTLQVLKGHLLLEELLRDIFELQLPHPTALKGNKGASYDCHQIICLVEAITPVSHTVPWIWEGAKKLNNIRNNLAHQLTPKGLDQKIDDLIECVKTQSPEIDEVRQEVPEADGHDLFLIIIAMCACLSSLKAILIENANHNA